MNMRKKTEWKRTRTVPLTVYGHQKVDKIFKDTQCQICDLLYKLQSPPKDTRVSSRLDFVA